MLEQCFCIQDAVRFFGLQASSAGDESSQELSTALAERRPRFLGGADGDAAGAVGDVLREHTESMCLPGGAPPQLHREAISYLAHAHPLLAACPAAMHDRGSAAVMGIVAAALESGRVLACHLEQVPEWVEQHIVVRAHLWMQQQAVSAMLQNFMPALMKQNDSEVKETFRLLEGRLCSMLQRASSSLASMSLDTEFWRRLELHRTVAGLQAVRVEVAACFGALLGDVHWDAHLSAVHAAVACGRALWGGYRPLAAWLASLEGHVDFLAKWRASGPCEPTPFRIGSVGCVDTLYSSCREETHLRLQPSSEKEDVATTSTVARNSEINRGMLVEGLRLVGASWKSGRIAASAGGADYEAELPPMLIRQVDGPAPTIGNWFLCPLIVAHRDTYANDLTCPPFAKILVRTALNPAICSMRGVRLVSYV